EREPARLLRDPEALPLRTLADRLRERARHAEQELRELVRKPLFVVREQDAVARGARDVAVEQQQVAVLRGECAQGLGVHRRVAVRGLAVRDVDDDGREAVRVRLDPLLQRAVRQLERLAHRRGARGLGVEPDRELHLDLGDAAGAVVFLLRALLDAGRVVRDRADARQRLAAQLTHQRRLDLLAVADDADVVVVAHAFGLGALDRQVREQLVDGVRHAVGFALAAAVGIRHGPGHVDEEQERARVVAADLGFVGHAASLRMWTRCVVAASSAGGAGGLRNASGDRAGREGVAGCGATGPQPFGPPRTAGRVGAALTTMRTARGATIPDAPWTGGR